MAQAPPGVLMRGRFQSASALASGRCRNGDFCWHITGFNPRPLSRADDVLDLIKGYPDTTVSIRVRSRERTMGTVDFIAVI